MYLYIDISEEGRLQTIVESDSTETIKFHWKISGESGDSLKFYIDSTLKDTITGEQDWQQKSYSVSSGIHTLKWVYTEGGSTEDNAWVDYIQWSGPSPVQDPSEWQNIEYKHDLYGRRSEKKVDGFSTRYLYDGPQVIAEYDGNNNLLRKYIYGPGIDQPICMIEEAESEIYYYHYDGLGSVMALSDSSGDTVQTYEYSVFGQVAVEDVNHPNPYMFAGRRFDIEIGLYYNRARYYNPYTGRFLQADPIGYGDGMNRYAYCANSPLGWTDAYGLLKDFSELRRNTSSSPIPVSVAFYNGSAPGFYEDANGAIIENASGSQFKEAADDFVGDGYKLYFDIGDIEDTDALTEFIETRLNRLKLCNYEVTDIYFFDHCGADENKKVSGLYFGKLWITASEIKNKGKDLAWDRILPESASVHFRHCYIGRENNRELLQNLATWTNRTVTGGTRMTSYNGPHDNYDPAWEQTGPDYRYGDLWGATPGGNPYEIWTQFVETSWYERYILFMPDLKPNDIPQSY